MSIRFRLTLTKTRPLPKEANRMRDHVYSDISAQHPRSYSTEQAVWCNLHEGGFVTRIVQIDIEIRHNVRDEPCLGEATVQILTGPHSSDPVQLGGLFQLIPLADDVVVVRNGNLPVPLGVEYLTCFVIVVVGVGQ